MSAAQIATDRVLCHCLGIAKSEVQATVDAGHASCLRSVMRQTGAGTGCTACHCAIKELLAANGMFGNGMVGNLSSGRFSARDFAGEPCLS